MNRSFDFTNWQAPVLQVIMTQWHSVDHFRAISTFNGFEEARILYESISNPFYLTHFNTYTQIICSCFSWHVTWPRPRIPSFYPHLPLLHLLRPGQSLSLLQNSLKVHLQKKNISPTLPRVTFLTDIFLIVEHISLFRCNDSHDDILRQIQQGWIGSPGFLLPSGWKWRSLCQNPTIFFHRSAKSNYQINYRLWNPVSWNINRILWAGRSSAKTVGTENWEEPACGIQDE